MKNKIKRIAKHARAIMKVSMHDDVRTVIMLIFAILFVITWHYSFVILFILFWAFTAKDEVDPKSGMKHY